MKPGIGARPCIRCGARLEGAQSTFLSHCPKCGAPLGGPRATPLGTPILPSTYGRVGASSGGGTSTLTWVVLIGLIVVIIGLGLTVLLLVRSRSDGQSSASSISDPVEIATAIVTTPTPPRPLEDAAIAKPQPKPTVAPTFTVTPRPTVTPTFTVTPRPTVTPTFVVPPPTSTVPRGEFDRANALRLMNLAADEVQSCKLSDGPTGTNVMTAIFRNDGRLNQVTYGNGPLSPDPRITGCITDKFLRIRVAPYDGAVERISRFITIR